MSTNVYILDFGNRIKIGRTKNIEQRIKTIENAVGEKAAQVFCLETDGEKEKLLHYYLHEHRTVGEYFTCSFDTAKEALQSIVNEQITGVVKPNHKIYRIKKSEHDIIRCNDLIRNAEHNLSAQEQKILLYLMSKINPNGDEFATYKFKMQDFFEMFGISEKSGGSYQHIRESIKNLHNKKISIKLNNDKKIMLNCIEEPLLREGSGTICVKISNDLKPYLLDFKRNATSYSLYYILAMKSKYSIRLYELLKSYENLGGCEFDIDRLKVLLDAEKYKLFGDFKVNVLNVAMKEINEVGDINITYELEKDGRKFSHIKFHVEFKKLMGADGTWKRIENSLSGKK